MKSPPEYKFYLVDSKDIINSQVYGLWVSPNRDKIELVIDSEGKYIQLNEENSENLSKIIIGTSLNGIE